MAHDYTDEGAEVPQGGEYVIKDGEYDLSITKIEEKKSSGGDYQVVTSLKVVSGEKKGFTLKNWVTFIEPSKNPKAAGMSIHWLKTIGEPWQGKFKIEPANWVGKTFHAYLEASEFNGYKSMKIKWIQPVAEETVPF
jgi:hypothetical protein